MILPLDFEERIGFSPIREWLREHCIGNAGVRKVEGMTFTSDPVMVRSRLYLANEFLELVRSGETYPIRHYADPEEIFRLASAVGACLEAQDLLQIGLGLESIHGWVKFFSSREEQYPLHFDQSRQLQLPTTVMREILARIDEQARIRDNASAELAQIRKRLVSAESSLRSTVNRLLQEFDKAGYTPEGATPSVRDGRVVLPVRAEFKRRIRGVSMGESATGQTVYMEPEALLEANNGIRDLQMEEQREVLRILRQLTAIVHEALPLLEPAFDFLAEMDFMRSKSLLARELESALPVIKDQPFLKWRRARHPLLLLLLRGKRPVVPLDVELDVPCRILLISGPNAGGKSVCLKTIGLLQYMMQCGVLPPADPDSEFGIFGSIMLDIGDQQSIENDLSTYSSHLRNMARFVRDAGPETLFLIDEMGAGTDPSFGGGIAEAVLDTLADAGSWGVVTTHYANLKTLATRREGIRNGAMLFDVASLTPLFILETGKPGNSYAMELARKSGLSPTLLDKARSIIGEELVGLESLLQRAGQDQARVEQLRRDLEARERQLKKETQQVEQLRQELESKRKAIIAKAKEEAAAMLKTTNREIEKTIRHIRENKAERKETLKVRGKLRELQEQVTPSEPSSVPVRPAVLREGDRVRLTGGDYSGVILSIKGDSAMVQFGLIRTQVKVSALEPDANAPEAKPERRFSGSVDLASRRMNFKPVSDMRGMRAEEVSTVLEAFLDDAVLLGVPEVRILHGKGEGVLRSLVREMLAKNPAVSSVADEHADRGGAGITIVKFK